MNFMLYSSEQFVKKFVMNYIYFSYQNRNANCSWTVEAPSGSHVKLKLIDGLFSNCGTDRMEFEYDGKILIRLRNIIMPTLICFSELENCVSHTERC